MSQGYYYLSNPYNGSPEERLERAEAACKATALLLQKGVYTLSPVVHNHQVVKHFPEMTADQRRALIMPYDLELLRASVGMILLKIPGWDQSKGVREEIDF
ncbi:MAG: DUF1937 family protein, partial [bacterium]|nr:DUF1937 family protein [bacterium]